MPHTSNHITKKIPGVNCSRLPGLLLRTFSLPLGSTGLPLRAFSLSFGNFSLPLGTTGLPLRAFTLSFGTSVPFLGAFGLPIRSSRFSVTGDRFALFSFRSSVISIRFSRSPVTRDCFGPIKGLIMSHIRESHFKNSVSTLLTAINDMRNKALKISHHPSLCSIHSF